MKRGCGLIFAALKESIDENNITKITWVNAEKQLADCLTKEGGDFSK